MFRIVTATALAALLASPALAQSSSDQGTSGSQWQMEQRSDQSGSGQGLQTSPGTSEDTLGRSQGAGNIPADCGPNDPRPECQTAQLPGQQQEQQGSPQWQQGQGGTTGRTLEDQGSTGSGWGGGMGSGSGTGGSSGSGGSSSGGSSGGGQ